MLNAAKLAEMLTDHFGVPMAGEAADVADGQLARFRPRDMPHTQGFLVNILIGWKTIETDFIPASYAKPLLSEMATANDEKKILFQTFIQSSIRAGAVVSLKINDGKVDPLMMDNWPKIWNSFSLQFIRGPMEIDGKNHESMQELAFLWSRRILGSVLSLMPLEPVSRESSGEVEGASSQTLVTRYERSEINRAACIEIYGTCCNVCGFDFERVYGVIGIGFIEVHHVQLVAKMAPDTILNPAVDLVPLCANCHRMAHKRHPLPYTVDDLKAMIRAKHERPVTH